LKEEIAMAGGYGTHTAQGGFMPDRRATEGTIGRRFVAYCIDIVVIAAMMGVLWLFIGLIGLLTFGLGWGLYALLPLTAIVYNALTISGAGQGTWGMRAAGLRVVDSGTGGPVGMLNAAVHAFLFYVAMGTTLLVVDILIGLFRSDSRMGRDIITGITMVRSS
jgi:uncharacterized RDD family membrane protein YckC